MTAQADVSGASFRGVAFCHVPAEEPISLEKLVTADGADDRWNGPGEPTLYLATDLPIALAELARHVAPGTGGTTRRRLLGLLLEIDGLVDLRQVTVRRQVAAPEAVEAFCDRATARDVARRIRDRGDAKGLLVPSVAFLDEPARANLVLFMEHLGGVVEPLVRGQREAGVVELRMDLDAAGDGKEPT